ncbi:MAG: ABC transporter permease subunit [bacterium]
MILRIARKEIQLNLLSFRFQVCIVLLFILIVGSMQIMATNYGRRLEDYSTGAEIHRDDLLKMNSRLEFEAFGVTQDPKPSILGVFAMGLEREMSRSFMIPGFATEERGQMSSTAPASKLQGMQLEASKYSNPVFTLFQPPDFVYVINIVLSLLAMLFAFDAVSGEKENQTLKLMLTNSVPRDAVLIGKWLGGSVSIIIPFFVAFIAGLLSIVIRPYVSFSGEDWIRITLLLAVSSLYVCVFFLLGMVLSTLTQRSATSLILSLFAWIFFVLVVPNVSPVIARQMVPLKTADQIVREEERIERDMRDELQNVPEEERAEKMKSLGEEIEARTSALEDAYLRRLARQVNASVNLSRLSPSSSFTYAAVNLAGTGVTDYNKLKERIIRYKYELRDSRNKFLLDDRSKNIPMLYIVIDYEKLPVFHQPRSDLASSISNSLLDLALLFVFAVAFFMVSFIRFLRYDVK